MSDIFLLMGLMRSQTTRHAPDCLGWIANYHQVLGSDFEACFCCLLLHNERNRLTCANLITGLAK
jgi:hypothetical protein